VALVASELSTPIGEIEAWSVARLRIYHAAAVRLIEAKAGKPARQESRLPGGRQTAGQQARAAFDAAAARQREKDSR
jgi:hypothetical protein